MVLGPNNMTIGPNDIDSLCEVATIGRLDKLCTLMTKSPIFVGHFCKRESAMHPGYDSQNRTRKQNTHTHTHTHTQHQKQTIITSIYNN